MLRSRSSVASLIDVNHPVICALGKTFGGVLPGRLSRVPGLPSDDADKKLTGVDRRGVGIRTDIVNEKLCNDVLGYLAPTLEAYKGCTIIDINPGACLWSMRLHDLLKPKRHLLMEPEERYHDTFIKPLLEKPCSTYVSSTLAGAAPMQYRAAFEEAFNRELLPPRPEVDARDPNLRELDYNILVTGNLARRQQEYFSGSGINAPPNYMLQQMSWAALANQLFHHSGLVRMLWWMPDTHRLYSIPEKAAHSTNHSANIQFCADVSEVVGVRSNLEYRALISQSHVKPKNRHPIIEAESVHMVQHRMQQMDMKIPDGRDQRPLSLFNEVPNQGVKSPVALRWDTLEQVNDAFASCRAFVDEVLDALDGSQKRKQLRILQPFLERLEYPQSLPLALSLGRLDQRKMKDAESSILTTGYQRAALLLDLCLRIICLEAHCNAMEEKGADVSDLKADVVALDAQLRERCRGVLKMTFDVVEPLIADQLALFCSPPVLTIDRRAYEPLQASGDDFWPKTELCLLDVTPKARDLSVPGIADRIEGIRTAEELIKSLFLHRAQPLPWVLEKIAPNAALDLIPKVPSLTDPRRGGRLNVEALQIRHLTDEMIEGLTKAWLEWPFKPERAQLALQHEEEGANRGETHDTDIDQ